MLAAGNLTGKLGLAIGERSPHHVVSSELDDIIMLKLILFCLGPIYSAFTQSYTFKEHVVSRKKKRLLPVI